MSYVQNPIGRKIWTSNFQWFGGLPIFETHPYCWWKSCTSRYMIDMVIVSLFTRFFSFRVLQDFFHQQYHCYSENLPPKATLSDPGPPSTSVWSCFCSWLFNNFARFHVPPWAMRPKLGIIAYNPWSKCKWKDETLQSHDSIPLTVLDTLFWAGLARCWPISRPQGRTDATHTKRFGSETRPQRRMDLHRWYGWAFHILFTLSRSWKWQKVCRLLEGSTDAPPKNEQI